MSSRRSGSATTRRGGDVVDGDLLAVAGVRVGQPVAGVLDLHRGEVLLGGAVEVHAAAGVEREVGRVGGTRAGGSAASRGRRCARRRWARGSPSAWCRRRPPGRRRRARPGCAGGRPRGPWRPRRRRRRRWSPGRRSSRGPGRRWRRRRSRGSRCAWCRRPATKPTSVQATPASSSAARAAATPYSTKLRPHLPQGCMPTPSTATCSTAISSPPSLPPAAHFHTITSVGSPVSSSASVNSVSTPAPSPCPPCRSSTVTPATHLAHDHQLLGRELDRGDAEGLVGIAWAGRRARGGW